MHVYVNQPVLRYMFILYQPVNWEWDTCSYLPTCIGIHVYIIPTCIENLIHIYINQHVLGYRFILYQPVLGMGCMFISTNLYRDTCLYYPTCIGINVYINKPVLGYMFISINLYWEDTCLH